MSTDMNVVLVHGAWADGSCWRKVIIELNDRGYRVTAAQLPLRQFEEDVAVARHVISLQQGPTILVGHSYGGAVITEAGAGSENVISLVYVSAFVPEIGETVGELFSRNPSPIGAQIWNDSEDYIWIKQEGFKEVFVQDVTDDTEAQVMAATQKPLNEMNIHKKIREAAWKFKPSYYLLTENDRVIPPDTQRFMAQRIEANITVVPSSHASMVTHAADVVRLIDEASKVFMSRAA